MPNPFFQFKQFTVYHDRCAMKVGTDGVLLGAWASVGDGKLGLDIGTGTGLISLMLAQRNPLLSIETIDIDEDAIMQAMDNINESPFENRITCKHISLLDFEKETDSKFDLIVSNPPFFVQSLKSPDKQRTLARHTDSLPIGELIELGGKLLSEEGRFSLIYPFDQKNVILDLAEQNELFPSRLTAVYPTPSSTPKRILIELSKKENSPEQIDLVIEKDRHIYSDEFIALVKDFYLKY